MFSFVGKKLHESFGYYRGDSRNFSPANCPIREGFMNETQHI